ncbi:RagB/SusD domain protein [Pseudopedobacter saltans DSM 12145]|uniref:RagB/SusD domain protein n=1 Tax=Pseudopedobacter saltans (strain ATCC 51119 / DSM 12145 / JCM 21818 / CCUG 39354 / LMG 10337 / NBRC 100064 / NCIMB 13643) TaxID=762903 RepID=F0S9G4_PSESL|nr:RagB/SusD family nutrient uptake outer membrane protein [Pseudopedobacter saltans]ADY53517.1 RagB/SusD domain protein [Pseudopedobacter saltans DSM 12145]
MKNLFKNTKRTFVFATLAITMVSSCKKALEEKPYSFLSPNNFYKNESDAKIAINGVYNTLYSWDLYKQPIWNMTMLDDDHVSGADWFLGTSGAGNFQGYWGVDGPWVGFYSLISRANTVIENVSEINENIDPEIKTRIIGEAYCLRGWAYFQLVQLYGQIPIRDKSLSVDPNPNVPKSSVKDVYAFIIEDFKKAEQMLLPEGNPKSGEPGRVKRGVAKAFLAKVYLTMASGSLANVQISVRGGQNNNLYTYQKTVVAGLEGLDSKEYFKLARDKAVELLGDNEYSLFTSWKDLWNKDNRNKKEHMWELQSLAGTDLFTNNLNAYFSAFSTFGRGAVWFTNNHYKDYEVNDLRVLEGVKHNYEMNNANKTKYFYPSWEAATYKMIGGVTYANNGTTDDRAYVIKYESVENQTIANSDAFFPLLRYAEVYLIAAEAENELSTTPSLKAYEYLKMIRDRAHATMVSGLTQDEFRSFVIAERAREFVFEGVRRFDLLRWGIYLQVMNKISTGQDNISKVRTEKHLLFPIPNGEMLSNKAIKENNKFW